MTNEMVDIRYLNERSDYGNYKISEKQIQTPDGLFFSIQTIICQDEGEIEIRCSPHSFIFLLVLKSSSQGYTEVYEGGKSNFKTHQYNVFRSSFYPVRVRWDKKGIIKFVQIGIPTSFLDNFLPDIAVTKLRPYLVETSTLSIFNSFMNFSDTINNSAKALLQDRIVNTYLGNSYLRLRAHEIILEFLQDFDNRSEDLAPIPNNSLPDRVKARMYQARDIILENLIEPPTIQEIARVVETNECYLKEQFKEVFGLTLYKYRQKVLMEKALRMLKDSDTKVAEIARQVGYKHATHFCSAFKKYYGFSPRNYQSQS